MLFFPDNRPVCKRWMPMRNVESMINSTFCFLTIAEPDEGDRGFCLSVTLVQFIDGHVKC